MDQLSVGSIHTNPVGWRVVTTSKRDFFRRKQTGWGEKAFHSRLMIRFPQPLLSWLIKHNELPKHPFTGSMEALVLLPRTLEQHFGLHTQFPEQFGTNQSSSCTREGGMLPFHTLARKIPGSNGSHPGLVPPVQERLAVRWILQSPQLVTVRKVSCDKPGIR